MTTVRDLLAVAGNLPGDSARLDAELLLCHCLQKPRTYLFGWPEAEVDRDRQRQFLALVQARQQGRPLAYLTGTREFWSLSVRVNEHTLIPRPDTETLVQWALELELPEQAVVADLGTGSGAIALALASERPRWQVLATDSSQQALRVARQNIEQLGLDNIKTLACDWLAGLERNQFNLLVSNPPYIASADPHLGVADLCYEPLSALQAGPEGLDDLRKIAASAQEHLATGGWLLLEHGFDQAPAVVQLLLDAGFEAVQSRRDMAGHIRASGGRRGDQ